MSGVSGGGVVSPSTRPRSSRAAAAACRGTGQRTSPGTTCACTDDVGRDARHRGRGCCSARPGRVLPARRERPPCRRQHGVQARGGAHEGSRQRARRLGRRRRGRERLPEVPLRSVMPTRSNDLPAYVDNATLALEVARVVVSPLELALHLTNNAEVRPSCGTMRSEPAWSPSGGARSRPRRRPGRSP